MVAFLDVCKFNPTTGGTTDWTVSSAVTGYQTPVLAGAVNATVYRYRAESSDLTQWEIGFGAYTVAGTVLARTTVLYNSSGTGTGTGQSGAGTKINFSTTPQVSFVLLAEDIINPSPITNSLGSAVLLSSTSTFFDGPTVAQGSVGTWFASGTVTLSDSGAVPALYSVKLWDGTNQIASASGASIVGQTTSISLSGFLASPAGNIRISVKDLTSTNGQIQALATAGGSSQASTVTAFRIG